MAKVPYTPVIKSFTLQFSLGIDVHVLIYYQPQTLKLLWFHIMLFFSAFSSMMENTSKFRFDLLSCNFLINDTRFII